MPADRAPTHHLWQGQPHPHTLLAAATLCVVRTNHCYMHGRKKCRSHVSPTLGIDHCTYCLPCCSYTVCLQHRSLQLVPSCNSCSAMPTWPLLVLMLGVCMQSGIHGWGLIARTEMKQDSMVVEYRGDLLRPKMSEDRQKFYNRIGKDCYLFNVNDDIIVDATMSGAIGRFTVRD